MSEIEKKKIVIIDDEEKFVKMIKVNLENDGNYEVITETDAQKGFEVVLKERPALVILDVLMKEKRGPEIAYEIKQHPKIQKTPIIFLTATVDKKQTEAFAGLVGGSPMTIKPTIAKPVKTKDLIQLIESEILAANE